MMIFRSKYHVIDHTTGERTEDGYVYASSKISPSAIVLNSTRTQYLHGSGPAGPEAEHDHVEIHAPNGMTAICDAQHGSRLVFMDRKDAAGQYIDPIPFADLYARGLKPGHTPV
jgi:hypothetical protein